MQTTSSKKSVGDDSLPPWKLYTFSGGPTCLPREVMAKVKKEFFNLKGSGLNIMQSHHRDKQFAQIYQQTRDVLKSLYNIPDGYRILILGGGGTLQFQSIPLNLLGGYHQANYINTGYWSKRAIDEAQILCGVNEVTTIKRNEKGEFFVPPQSQWKVDPNSPYFHYCDNETVEGLEFHNTPDVDPQQVLITDMSSNFLTKRVDWNKLSIVYTHAQKNVGIAGSTVVIIQESIVDPQKRNPITPALADWEYILQHDGLQNTPPVLPIYINNLCFNYIQETGGVDFWYEESQKRSQLIYDVLDSSHGFYQSAVRPDFRSRINIAWNLATPEEEQQLIQAGQEQGLIELSGHRSIGGLRASLYIPVPTEGIQKLRDFLDDYYHKHS